jgi:hypothetical protein
MAYDRACYERRKHMTLKKSDGEEFVAYRTIRSKWHMDDFHIRDLLKTHTLTEIMEGEMVDGKLKPKEMVYLDNLVLPFCAIVAILLAAVAIHSEIGGTYPNIPILSSFLDR